MARPGKFPTPSPPAGARRGFTLIEVVAFIVIVSAVAVGLVSALTGGLRTAYTPREINQALELAQSRMELVLTQKRRLGFTAFLSSYDPCTLGTPEACVVPSGYTVSVSLAQTFSNNDANYRIVTVTVIGGIANDPLAVVKALVANY